MIVGGTFLNVAGAGRNRAARLGPAGTALAFNPNPNGAVNALALQADFIGQQWQDLNLITGVLVGVALVLPKLKAKLRRKPVPTGGRP